MDRSSPADGFVNVDVVYKTVVCRHLHVLPVAIKNARIEFPSERRELFFFKVDETLNGIFIFSHCNETIAASSVSSTKNVRKSFNAPGKRYHGHLGPERVVLAVVIKLPHAVLTVEKMIVAFSGPMAIKNPYFPAFSGLPSIRTSVLNVKVVFSFAPARHGAALLVP